MFDDRERRARSTPANAITIIRNGVFLKKHLAASIRMGKNYSCSDRVRSARSF